MVVDLAGKIGILLLGRLEYDLGSIGKFMRCKVDFAEAAFANEPAESVVANGLEVGRGELAQERLV